MNVPDTLLVRHVQELERLVDELSENAITPELRAAIGRVCADLATARGMLYDHQMRWERTTTTDDLTLLWSVAGGGS